MQNPAFRAYLENKILTATPEQLQLMLYEGAIRFANVAKVALVEKDFEKAHNAFERLDGIFLELHNGLRPNLDADLCDKYASLYNFCMRKLLEANYSRSTSAIDEALVVMQHLRETWVMVLEKLSSHKAQAATALEPQEAFASHA
jgi:flagellar protein FliS